MMIASRSRLGSLARRAPAFLHAPLPRAVPRIARPTPGRHLVRGRHLHASSILHTPYPTPAPIDPPINGLSSVVGSTSPPLDERTLGAFWDATVAGYPTSPALVSRWERPDQHLPTRPTGGLDGEECLRWSFEEMDRNVDALARGMLAMGLKKGDRVGVFLGNGSAYAMMQWASAKVGIIMACINPASRGPELLSALNLTSCTALFIAPSIKKSDLLGTLHELLPSLSSSPVHQLNDPACPSLKSVILVDNTSLGATAFADFLADNQVAESDFRNVLEWDGPPPKAELANSEVINLQFTSGTTGFPKAVALTHRNLLNNGAAIGQCLQLRPPNPEDGWSGERLSACTPLFHCFGHGVPTMFVAQLALLDRLEKGETVPGLSELPSIDFSHLRTGIAAGSPVPDETMRRLMKRMNLTELTITYGQTETSPATVMSSTTDPVDLRCTTVGRVMPHTHIRIVDTAHALYPAEETPSVALGVPGELWSAGYQIQHGYWANQAETDKVVFRDAQGVRWMKTGDEAIMNEEGYISIVGRIKDIIIRGGENIFPVVVENRALLLPGIADCSIIAVPCPRMGEAVGAFVQIEDSPTGRAVTAEALAEHIDRLMSHQAKPEWVWWLGRDGVPSEYPKTASGKIRKVELRDWAKELQGRGVGRVAPPAAK
ncbi:hypothetical protein RQP46_002488 [Phenoliferia psychrophenolica]